MGRVMFDLDYIDVTTAKGRDYYYYRRAGKRVKLPAPTDPKFMDAYNAVHARFEKKVEKGEPPAPIQPRSFAALVEEFKASPGFKQLADSTRYDYGWHLDKMVTLWSDLRPVEISRRAILAHRDTFAEAGHPRQGNYAVAVVRLLFSYAEDVEFPGLPKNFKNPAAKPRHLKEGDGYKAWPEPVIEKYCTVHANDEMRLLALMLGLLAGQPRGDAIARNRTHWNGTELVAARHKNGEPIWLLAMPPLKALLVKAMAARFMMLVTPTGRPFTKRTFSRWFREGCELAGIGAEYHYHGLRVTAAEILSVFCDDATLQAIFGWRTASMAAHYRRRANKRQAALAGMKRWLEQNLIGLPNSLLSGPK